MELRFRPTINSTDAETFGEYKLLQLKRVEELALQLAPDVTNSVNYTLLSGLPGITLFYAYLSRLFPEKNYSNQMMEALERCGQALSTEALPPTMSIGVAGIAFVFQHLRNIGLLDKEEDLNLSELDAFISDAVDYDNSIKNWDPLHGMIGSGIYFLERNLETGETSYLEKIVDYLASMRTNHGKYRLWITTGHKGYSDDNYNFGMAHGMPGIISFLALVHQRGIKREKIEELITQSLPYLLENHYPDESICGFPTAIDVISKKDVAKWPNSRLGWCYGDLCIAFTLLHAGKALQKEEWHQQGIQVALKTTLRNLENSDCVDSGICHGSVGLAHQYLRLFHATGINQFLEAAQKWVAITEQHFYKPEKFETGYFSASYDATKTKETLTDQHGLLEGAAGVGLTYISFLTDLKPDWDIPLLTNV